MTTLLEKLYDEYNVEDDPTGSIGHAIANMVYLSRKASKYEDSRMREFERNKLKTPPIKETVQKRYREFYNRWRTSRINENNFETYIDEKRKALLIFPKFCNSGVQSIENYSDEKISSLYKQMLDYAREKVNE